MKFTHKIKSLFIVVLLLPITAMCKTDHYPDYSDKITELLKDYSTNPKHSYDKKTKPLKPYSANPNYSHKNAKTLKHENSYTDHSKKTKQTKQTKQNLAYLDSVYQSPKPLKHENAHTDHYKKTKHTKQNFAYLNSFYQNSKPLKYENAYADPYKKTKHTKQNLAYLDPFYQNPKPLKHENAYADYAKNTKQTKQNTANLNSSYKNTKPIKHENTYANYSKKSNTPNNVDSNTYPTYKKYSQYQDKNKLIFQALKQQFHVGVYSGYGVIDGAYKQDGQFAQGRLSFGVDAVHSMRFTLGPELGLQSGKSMRLALSSDIDALSGGLPWQTTLSPILDILIATKTQFSAKKPIYFILKAGAAYRQLQFNDRTSTHDYLQKINPEAQAGLGFDIAKNIMLSMYYQGIYSSSTTGASIDSYDSSRISSIPTQQAGWIGVEFSI